MPKVYGYCRVSHEDSTASGLGIDAQLHSITQWWEHEKKLGHFPGVSWGTNGWKGEKAVGQATTDGLFIDQSVSAYRFPILKRPAGWWLGATLEPGDVVVFARLDRAFRNLLDFAQTIHRWMKKDVHCVFINPAVDMSTPYGMAFAQIAAVFAELESALKAERLREAQARGRERGQKMTRHTSFGWRQDGWTTRLVGGVSKRVPVMVPDEQEREEVRLIVQWHDIDGLSFADVADKLEATRALQENREPWPRVPYKGSENRKWTASRCHKAYKARLRVPLPGTTMIV
jgi:DNA invertase Pin-like site-specific DNA recombinase